MRTVVFVTYPGIKLLDLTGPVQVFADTPSVHGNQLPYRTVVASLHGGRVSTDTCITVNTVSFDMVKRWKIDTLLVVGGSGAHEAATDTGLVQWTTKLGRRARRVGSVCTGAFLLAATGLLDGKSAVTHWESCSTLAGQYPDITVERDPIYINDRGFWSSAGVTAGIDLALAMVADDLGRQTALNLARSLVVYMARPGGQSQFSTILQLQSTDRHGRFDDLHRWIIDNLNSDLRVDALAARVHMSARNFSRIYATETGQTPAKAVETMRVEAARSLLEESHLSVSEIAAKCGFVDDERMRRSFIRTLKVPPAQYRQRFQA